MYYARAVQKTLLGGGGALNWFFGMGFQPQIKKIPTKSDEDKTESKKYLQIRKKGVKKI